MQDITLTIVGNVTRDPELTFTPGGQAAVRFQIATTPRHFDRQRGEYVDEETTFLGCQAWGPLAEHAAESLSRGTRVIAQGRLQTQRWQDRESGQTREALRLQVDAIGPELRFVTATVSRTSRQSAEQEQRPEDPWAHALQAARQTLGGHEVPAAEAPF